MKLSEVKEVIKRLDDGRLELRLTHEPTGELAAGWGDKYVELRTRLLRRLAHKVDDADRQQEAADFERMIRA